MSRCQRRANSVGCDALCEGRTVAPARGPPWPPEKAAGHPRRAPVMWPSSTIPCAGTALGSRSGNVTAPATEAGQSATLAELAHTLPSRGTISKPNSRRTAPCSLLQVLEHREARLFVRRAIRIPVGDGTGLGLYVSKAFIASHGGRMCSRARRAQGVRSRPACLGEVGKGQLPGRYMTALGATRTLRSRSRYAMRCRLYFASKGCGLDPQSAAVPRLTLRSKLSPASDPWPGAFCRRAPP